MTRKSKIVGVATALALTGIGGGAAIAYRNATGSTPGTATNGVGGGAVVLTATFAAGLVPGGSTPIAYTAANSTSHSVLVTDLSATVTIGADGCLPEWFTATAEASQSTVPAGASGVPVGCGTLSFADTTDNQDACRRATVTVAVTSK